MNRRYFQVVIGFAVSIVCIIALFTLVDVAAIGRILRSARPGFLLLGVVYIVMFLVLRAVRWRYLLTNSVPGKSVFHIQNVGYMLSQFLPLRLGDVARAVLIGNQPPVTVPQGVSTMAVERVLDMVIIVLLLPLTLTGVAALPGWLRQGALLSTVLAVVGLVGLTVLANFRPKRLFFGRLPRLELMFSEGLHGLQTLTHWRSAITLLALSIAVWVPIIFAYHAVLQAVNLSPTLALAGFAACAGALSMAAPASPGQVGVFHAGVAAALLLYGHAAGDAAAVAVIYHALNFGVMVLLGVVGMWMTDLSFGRLVAATQTQGN
ncbi:MAG: flippase-like domain-containing protein [Anaerolineae bacterium]|nr:flippase-like domain-containing protein [Anaerolineae bacterium]MCO5187014.1 flippase-like domain-containing protein [Anaerolineae bacterium]MCO5195220.1 flippase-like domain-containing protein [Anaerolineae bacterium]MCO5198227.1 flippase-like domain-containing protein [Anaerolineae bacterium]MCO5205204.1 flippase-like domain-containing protein [Anaerolineae bacterium]